MADEVKVNPDELADVQREFQNQSQSIQEMFQRTRKSMDQLEPDWIGLGSDAFFEEMEGEVLPAVQRLQQALEQAGMVTGEILHIFQQAAEEASSPFRT
jgi:WXG100 family type VII secretion target